MAGTSEVVLTAEEVAVLRSKKKRELEKRIWDLRGKIDSLWLGIYRVTCLYVAVLTLVLKLSRRLAPHCSDAWVDDTLITLVAMGHLLSFCKLAQILKEMYTKLLDAKSQLREIHQFPNLPENGGLGYRIWIYRTCAIIGLLDFMAFTVLIGVVSRELRCS